MSIDATTARASVAYVHNGKPIASDAVLLHVLPDNIDAAKRVTAALEADGVAVYGRGLNAIRYTLSDAMKPDADFKAALDQLGINQAGYRHAIFRLTGHHVAPTTTSRWVRGERSPEPSAMAVLALLGELPAKRLAALTARLPADPET